MQHGPLADIMAALGYEFQKPELLRAALTHRSHASEHVSARYNSEGVGPDNERLEFLGDSLLNFLVAQALWERVPAAREGDLSRFRAAVVNEPSLAEAALRCRLGEGLRLGRGEHRGGGRTRPSTLADAMEAVLAAVFLDGGLDAARTVVLHLLGDRLRLVVADGARDDRSTLQEFLQAEYKVTPQYEVVGSSGPDHQREYEVELRAATIVSARGRGRSKKEAALHAAQAALRLLKEQAPKPSLLEVVLKQAEEGKP